MHFNTSPGLSLQAVRIQAAQVIASHAQAIDVIARGLADLDAAIQQADERTVDDRNALLAAQQRLSSLLPNLSEMMGGAA